ncbi:MAG: cob(I)yrinic acid a,c-diamide adenosyltransferase [Dehalococcoidia bacterium]
MSNDGAGLVQVLTGNGRGKTTAALGTVLRAVGQGLRVHIVHFMKGTYPYGEQRALTYLPGVTVSRFGKLDFCDPSNIQEDERNEARRALEDAREAIRSGEYDLVVLDEVNIASGWGLIPVTDVVELIRRKPEKIELILTGRYADEKIIEAADLVTEMVEVKHPYQQGIKARQGFEY